jgi:hypothetical protein
MADISSSSVFKSVTSTNWYVVTCNVRFESFSQSPVRIRARIDPPHPLVCHKRRLNGAVLRMRPKKPRSRVTVGVAR